MQSDAELAKYYGEHLIQMTLQTLHKAQNEIHFSSFFSSPAPRGNRETQESFFFQPTVKQNIASTVDHLAQFFSSAFSEMFTRFATNKITSFIVFISERMQLYP